VSYLTFIIYSLSSFGVVSGGWLGLFYTTVERTQKRTTGVKLLRVHLGCRSRRPWPRLLLLAGKGGSSLRPNNRSVQIRYFAQNIQFHTKVLTWWYRAASKLPTISLTRKSQFNAARHACLAWKIVSRAENSQARRASKMIRYLWRDLGEAEWLQIRIKNARKIELSFS